MPSSNEIRAGAAYVELRAKNDALEGDMRGAERKMTGIAGRISKSIGSIGLSTNPLKSSFAQLAGARGLGGMAAAAGPAGIAVGAAMAAGVAAVNQLIQAFEAGADHIRKMRDEAAKTGQSVESISGGRVRSSDVENIEQMDAAITDLQNAWGALQGVLASGVAPAITAAATAFSLSIDVLLQYRDSIASVLDIATDLIPVLSALKVAAEIAGLDETVEDFQELAEAKREEIRLETERQKLLAQIQKRDAYLAGLKEELRIAGLSTEEAVAQRALMQAQEQGLKGVYAAEAQRLILQKQQLEAMKAQQAAVDQYLSQLREELKLVGATAAERARHEAKKRGASTDEQEEAAQLAQAAEDAKKVQEEKERQAALDESRPQRLAEAQAEADRLYEQAQDEQRRKAEETARETQRQLEDLKRRADRIKKESRSEAEVLKDDIKEIQDLEGTGDLTKSEADKAKRKRLFEAIGAETEKAVNQTQSRGTFSAAAAAAAFGGGDANSKQEKQIKLAEEQVKLAKDMLKKLDEGGLFIP